MPTADPNKPSLENFLETEETGLEILHPGGLEITREMAEACHLGTDSRVLEVASGTGEAACFLVEQFHCSLVGVDVSERMVAKARAKAARRKLPIEFRLGDAVQLPFDDATFDAVVSECTMCLLDMPRAAAEMVRVARAGGYVAMHDILWRDDTPEETKQHLADLEDERPETLGGWKRLFEEAGLHDVVALDRSAIMATWSADINRQLGLVGRLRLLFKILRRWGWAGYRSVRATELLFRSPYMGYCIVVGRKA
jgi:arsenite methyltransferase